MFRGGVKTTRDRETTRRVRVIINTSKRKRRKWNTLCIDVFDLCVYMCDCARVWWEYVNEWEKKNFTVLPDRLPLLEMIPYEENYSTIPRNDIIYDSLYWFFPNVKYSHLHKHCSYLKAQFNSICASYAMPIVLWKLRLTHTTKSFDGDAARKKRNFFRNKLFRYYELSVIKLQ